MPLTTTGQTLTPTNTLELVLTLTLTTQHNESKYHFTKGQVVGRVAEAKGNPLVVIGHPSLVLTSKVVILVAFWAVFHNQTKRVGKLNPAMERQDTRWKGLIIQ